MTITQNHHTPLPPLTEKEKAVLEMIEVSLAERGLSPSYQEIKDHFGFASFNSVQNYLKQLSNKGYIQIPSHQKRAIQVLSPAHSVQSAMKAQRVNAPSPLSSQRSFGSSGGPEAIELPLLGKVAAGLPLESFEHDEFVDVPVSLVRNPNKTFALKVSGSSMIEDGIHDGDILLVQKQTTATNGEIVVASVENESTVKRFFLREDTDSVSGKVVELKPANSTMKSMWYPPQLVKIQGIVVGLVRKF
jgi:repressor LexA